LITGVAGFIGSHLVDLFLSRGHQVTAIDNLVTGREANLAHLAGNAQFQFVHADITEPLPELGRFEAILDFASPASRSTSNGFRSRSSRSAKKSTYGSSASTRNASASA
jgi:nucleoside-diphosphate-sugar epimerase